MKIIMWKLNVEVFLAIEFRFVMLQKISKGVTVKNVMITPHMA